MTTTTELPVVPEPRVETFTEEALPSEPKSDVKLVTASGMTLRERVRRIDTNHGVTLLFTYTQLDANGEVVLDTAGEPRISDPHEVSFDGEGFSRVGEEGVAASLQHGREVAVARAVDHFNGLAELAKLSSLLPARF